MTPERWKQVELLYHSILKQEPNQRAAFLKEACAEDEELQREVESLLAFEQRAESFIEAPPEKALEDAARGLAADSSSPPLTGDIGHYQILSRLGEGGMGVVYKVRDKNLDRSVALKVLSAGLVADPEHRKRLVLEARLASALNHPNIITVHEIASQDGIDFIVMEYVAGKSLDQLIPHRGLPLKEALRLAIQIGEGLAAAHAAGIIHRDLKPGNVMVSESGLVKVLDFGLAKLATRAGRQGSDFPTMPASSSAPKTAEGTLLGTVVYMSPEQAEGKNLDARSDVFSFGLVLYEMVTGQRAFAGESNLAILTAILHEEPEPVGQIVKGIPHELERIISRCMRKERERRAQTMGDVKIALQEVKEELESEVHATVPAGSPAHGPEQLMAAGAITAQELGGPSLGGAVGRHLRFGWLIAACATALVIGILIGPAMTRYFRPGVSQTSQPVVRSSVRLEPGHWLEGMRGSPPIALDLPTRTAMAISKDGRFIVYSAVKDNPSPKDKAQVYRRGIDQLEGKPITGTEGGIAPFLSPDDHWVGFWADGKLMKVSLDGGVPSILCEVSPFGFSWGPDNQIVFGRQEDSGLSRVSADGGQPETLTTPDKSKSEYAHHLPYCLPAGRGILFTITRDPWDMQPRVAVLDLATRKWRTLLEDAADARFVPTGHLAFLRRGTLMGVPFDPGKLEVTGQPVPVVANVAQALNTGNAFFESAAGQFSISASGSLVYASAGILPEMQNSLVWVDHKGKVEPIVSFKAPFFAPRLSPDGRRIAYTSMGALWQTWVYDLDRGTATQVTFEGRALFAAWTPDSRRLAIAWSKTGVSNIYWQPADGSSPMERLTQSEFGQLPGSWSPDGERLAFLEEDEIGLKIQLLNIRDRQVTPFLHSRFRGIYPEFSPDGRWMAYVSSESERLEAYVQPFPGGGSKQKISNEGGLQPLWAPNGKQLFYRSGEAGEQVWVVDVQTESGFSASKPRLLFKLPGAGMGMPIRTWDISPDGRRFLMTKYEERKSQPLTEMILVQNWFEELKRLVPSNK